MANSVAENNQTTSIAVILFASTACADVPEWSQRFERYRNAGGRQVRVLTVDRTGREWLGALPDAEGAAVLWDVAGGVPPKEIELLARDWRAGDWRAGVRFSGSPARGVSAWRLAVGRLIGQARRLLGLVSDPHPPCIAVSCAELKRRADLLVRTSPHDWTAVLIQSALRDRSAVREVPLMWSAASTGPARELTI